MLMVILSVILTFTLTGCSSANIQTSQPKKISVVTTIFPIYDWTRTVLGNNPGDVELTMLLDSRTDLHSYQPTAEDIARIKNADLFIYVGGESDEWVDDVIEGSDVKAVSLLGMMKGMLKEEEVREGMQEEEGEGEGEDGPEYDEHVWLSVRNAGYLTTRIAAELESLDPSHIDSYSKNTAAYAEELEILDREYKDAVDNGTTSILLFGDRFPFRYMVDDYSLDYYAAFVGCSAETEASFETIAFLAQKMDELGLNHVMVIEGTDHDIAKTIIENTADKNQDILVLDSLQSVTDPESASYIETMRDNLEVLKRALN